MEKCPYIAPHWAASAAPEGYSLEILKEGKIIEKIPLNSKTHFILGRMGGSVDILMEHVSISRQHCCLQFRDDDVLMVLDLGSAQGSFLNKTKLAKDIYQRVNVGDILRFGASTRLYIVNGPAEQMPSEYDSANMKLYREKLVQNTAKIEAKKLEDANTGASWGFGEDAENPPSDDDEEAVELPDYVKNDTNYDRKHGKKYSSGLFEESSLDSNDGKIVSEKDAAIMEKIRGKERKIQNMQEEIRRIYLKESSQPDGLTDGQGAAVSRNDKRIEELKESIQELMDNLKLKSLQRDGKSLGGRGDKKDKNALNNNNDDNDEIFDTTFQTADISTNWRLKRKLSKQGDGLREIKAIQNNNQSNGINDFSSRSLTYEDLRLLRDDQNNIINNIHKRVLELENIVSDCSKYFISIQNKKELIKNNNKNIDMKINRYDIDIDDVDSFVLETRSKEATSTLKSLRIEEASALVKSKNIEKLLKIATPAIQSLVSKTKINNGCGNKNNNNNNNYTDNDSNIKIDNSNNDNNNDNNNNNNNKDNSHNNKGTMSKIELEIPLQSENKNLNKSSEEGKINDKNESVVKSVKTALGHYIENNDHDCTISDKGKDSIIIGSNKNVNNNSIECEDNKNSEIDTKKSEVDSKKSETNTEISEVIINKKESKKRMRLEETAQMQSLSSFMKFAEEEKRKNEKEEKLRKLREIHGDDFIEVKEKIEQENIEIGNLKGEKRNKKVRLTNEFTSNSFEIGKSEFESESELAISSDNINSNSNSTNKNRLNEKKLIGAQRPIDSETHGKTEKMKNNSDNNQLLSTTVRTGDANTLQGGEAVWIPPKGQTGDGRTALNARLGY